MKFVYYNRDNAVRYAEKWALARNPDYYDFDSLGGDCTNFVSQCLYAGSGVMNYNRDFGWYYNSLNDRAPAWTGAEFLRTFLLTNTQVGPMATQTTIANLEIGDIISPGNKEQSEPAKNAALKRLLNFSLSPCVSKASISKSKIHLHCKHFWSKSLNCADLFLIKAQKRRNTLCIPSIFNAE